MNKLVFCYRKNRVSTYTTGQIYQVVNETIANFQSLITEGYYIALMIEQYTMHTY